MSNTRIPCKGASLGTEEKPFDMVCTADELFETRNKTKHFKAILIPENE